MNDPNDGVPGEEPEPTVLASNDTQNAVIAFVIALVKTAVYVLLPPIYLYRGRPILERLLKWWWIYALSAIAGISLTIVTGELTPVLAIPIFHLLLIVMAVTVAEALLTGGSVSLLTTGIVAATGVLAAALAVLSEWVDGEVETDTVHLNPAADEYVIPMTEVWKSGGKHDD